jgi:hypothetical protein
MSPFTRGRLAFREWRRTRPFWGGFFLLLSGIEYYVSAHLDLLPLKVAFGYQGFLSWLIPLILLLCGLLTWLTPAQRMFYGIVGSVCAISGMIALNIGGFFVGMLLGIVGGALAVAWVPKAPRPVAVEEPPEELPEELPSQQQDVETTDVLPTGPLTDQLPPASTSPLGVPPVQGPRHAAGRDDPPGSRSLALVLVVAAVTTALLALPQPDPAAAAPCKPGSSGGTAPKPPAPTPSAPASPSASPSPSPTGPTDPLSKLFGSLGKLLGITPDAAPAAPQAAPAAAPTPTPTKPGTAPKPLPGCGPSSPAPAKPPGPRQLAVPPGQPLVNKVPSKQITAKLSQADLTFDGVVDLPVQGGTLRTLQFSLSSSTSTPFELQVPGPSGTFSIKSSQLTVSGHVRLFVTRIQGKLDIFGIPTLPVDYTPDSPPLIVPKNVTFDDATVQLVFVHCDKLTAPKIRMSFI